jgi:hypothetical protein
MPRPDSLPLEFWKVSFAPATLAGSVRSKMFAVPTAARLKGLFRATPGGVPGSKPLFGARSLKSCVPVEGPLWQRVQPIDTSLKSRRPRRAASEIAAPSSPRNGFRGKRDRL